ncbi:nucleotidyl transferase AbiEii/AbiGii toxin family protein [Verminephrobacter eiseniae]|nr:nucleotidyl transferase AbiEii/AbiGii toxin family protein [Verminephrobacter eiseniae]
MLHLEEATIEPQWTFGGGTVLMLRFDHRFSKDIDLFVPDPQYLGHVNPRLGGPAEELTSEYEESAEFIKLQLPEGEIDVVVGAPLTAPNFEIVEYERRPIRVETSAEIIAKKMWHRGDQAKARDLFDLCAVATFEPDAIEVARPFMRRHAAAFLRRLDARAEMAELEFDEIEASSFRMSFRECLVLAHTILDPL